MDWRTLSTVDAVALAVVALAVARGLWIGVIREAFSLVSIAAACVAVRAFTAPAAGWLLEHGPADLSPPVARIAGAVLVALAAVVGVRLAGRVLRRGVHAVGLGFADRLGGGVLGAAEGALLLALALLVGVTVLGPEHPALRDSRALATFEEARRLAGLDPDAPRDVAAPPPDPGARR